MKTFQIRDLMVSINATAHTLQHTVCVNYTDICHWGCSIFNTPIFCQFGCTNHITPICQGGCSVVPSIHCGITIRDWHTTTPIQIEIEDFQEAELAGFKANLAELQQYVDQKLKRTPAELDALETKLSEAINEVRAQRESLGKQ